MRVDRSHTPWVILTIIATAGATLLFLANFYPTLLPFEFKLPPYFGEVPPLRHTFGGTPLGLFFGALAFLIFLFASALGIRKKKRLWRIGSVQFWLKAHIWLTIFTIPLVLYHCGFHSGGVHTSALMILYVFVMGSGFFGLAMQQFMPRMMKEQLPKEVVFEQIPHIRGLIYEAALQLRHDLREAAKVAQEKPVAAGAAGEAVAVTPDTSVELLGDFLDEECLPYLRSSRGGNRRLDEAKSADNLFRLLKLSVSEKWTTKVGEMHGWCEDRRLMDLQAKLHHWLHGWLIIHIPTSFALLIFTAWHAYVALCLLIQTS